MAKSAITVRTATPPTQQDKERPYGLIFGDLSGYVEPPADDVEIADEPATRITVREVTPTVVPAAV